MAKKNKVTLIGEINEIINEKDFTIKIRKNSKKFVYPIIELENENMQKFKKGSLVVVEGKITTELKEEKYTCSCGEKIIDKYILTKVTAQNIQVIPPKKEVFLNNVILLGVVCREKSFVYIEGTKSPLGNTRYQIAVNRREPNLTDYPWITSYARQAEEDAKRIQKGSQVLVDGIINTRRNIKECVCPNCGTKIEVTEYLTEVVAASVEYLNNCIF